MWIWPHPSRPQPAEGDREPDGFWSVRLCIRIYCEHPPRCSQRSKLSIDREPSCFQALRNTITKLQQFLLHFVRQPSSSSTVFFQEVSRELRRAWAVLGQWFVRSADHAPYQPREYKGRTLGRTANLPPMLGQLRLVGGRCWGGALNVAPLPRHLVLAVQRLFWSKP